MSREPSELLDVEGHDEVLLSRVRARAKAAWSQSLLEDDLTRRAASEQRLMAAWPRPRVLPVRSFVLGAAAAACATAAVFLMMRGGGAPATNAGATASSTATANAPTSGGGAAMQVPSVAVTSLADDVRAESAGLVVTGACPDCQIDRASVEPGRRLSSGHKLSVPRGVRVTLGFALQNALVDPAMGVDVEGPAVASVAGTAGAQTISLERGIARFRGVRDVEVSIPGGRVQGNGATFTVTIDARGASHVSVEKGRVVLTSNATAKAQTLEAGAVADVADGAVNEPAAPAATTAAGHAAAPAPAPSSASSTTATAAHPADAVLASAAASSARNEEASDPVTSARTRFHDGDTAGARAQLETLARSHDAGVSRRASFTLAEIEMASGDPSARARGRARLRDLAACPDVRLAADAATLLARSEPTASARAEAWARYLATSPPPTYRDRALLERAEALLDAGRRSEANAIVAELRNAPLSDAQRRQLERLSFKAKEMR